MDERLLPPSCCPQSWRYRPCFLRASPFAPDLQTDSPSARCTSLPMNEDGPFKFESDLFVGLAHVRITGTKDVGDGYFPGKRRRMQVAIQGQFKMEVAVGDVLTGQALNRPLTNMPNQTIVRGVLGVLKSLSPSAKIDLSSTTPFATNVLAGTAQAIDVSHRGQEPDIRAEIRENNKLLGEAFSAGSGMSDAKRKKFFQSTANGVEYKYRTDLVYTFDFYQDRMDPVRWILDFSVKHFQLARYLNQQPIQVMSMTPDRKFFYNFEIWHECLLDQELAKRCEIEASEAEEAVNRSS